MPAVRGKYRPVADLTYDVTELVELGNRLTRLSGDLERDGRLPPVGRDEVNSSEIVDALQDFAGDWDDKREEVAISLESLGEMVDQAVEAFTGADQELAAKAREIIEQNEVQPEGAAGEDG